MERNPNDPMSNSASTGMGSGTGGTSALGTGTDSISVTGTGAGQSAATGGMGGTTGGDVGSLDLGQVASGGTTGGTPSLADRASTAKDTAAEKLGQAREIAGERLGQAKEKATQLKATLADKLEAGASSLRQSQGGASAFAGADGSTTAETNPQLAQLRTTGADVMQKTATFLREGDLRATVEEQMRTNPGRTLLIAVGLGYVLGKAIRSDRR